MKQITAVEWLEERLTTSFGIELRPLRVFFVIAKEMEKQQVIHAYGQGVADEIGEIVDATKDAEQYYTENYKDK